MLSLILKELRSRKNITQSDLASALGVSLGAVGNWESNKRMPDYETLKKLADYFDVSIDYLLGRETKKAPGVQDNGGSNVITIAARDGGVIERKLSDDQLNALKAILDQMPELDNNNI